MTKDAKKLILRIVLWNALILVVICSLPLGGLTIAIIYSVILYFLLRRYISKLQKKYGLLLKATNEIAQGNLNVTIEEDLGVFEPFKPQIYRIEEGFRNAVAEEVKSQRIPRSEDPADGYHYLCKAAAGAGSDAGAAQGVSGDAGSESFAAESTD